MSCIVIGCKMFVRKEEITYYCLPQKKHLQQKWIDASGWSRDVVDLDAAQICSLHFDDSCFEVEIKEENDTKKSLKTLKESAVPTLFLPNIAIKTEFMNDGNNERLEKTFLPERYDTPKPERALQPMKTENMNLMTKIAKKKATLAELKRRVQEQQMACRRMETRCFKHEKKRLSIKEQERLLGKVLSVRQTQMLLGKQKVCWTEDDMCVGWMILSLTSKRCFTYFKKNLHIPLPGYSCIKQWASGRRILKTKSMDDNN